MKIGIVKESRKGEARVAATPEVVKKLNEKLPGSSILVEKGAGKAANIPDKDFEAAGAKTATPKQAWEADVVIKINPPTETEAAKLKKGALLVALMEPYHNDKLLKLLAKNGVHAVALESVPRTSRAQSMDVLSSQANIAGYRAVLEATQHLNRFMPLMMTAAGSAKAARVMVLGAGVAGLQAIATARRLGAVVEAFDVRPEVAEQIESLGAKFIDLDIGETASGEGGYAKELSAEGKKKQQAALQEHLKKADVVVTTAQIPGKKAPVLVTKNALKGMAPGSVVVDMAAATGGNVEGSAPDTTKQVDGVSVVGITNYPALMAKDASLFFGRNVVNLLGLFADVNAEKKKTTLKFDLDDDIIAGCLAVYDGKVRFGAEK